MNRRRFLLVACAVAAGFGARAASARDAKRVRRIVFFGVRRSDVPSVLRDLVRFRDELRRHGFHEGRDYALEYVSEASLERLPATMRGLLERPAHLIVAITTPVALAAARSTQEVPIVFGLVSDPVASGLVKSIRRPGGNATGVANVLPELSAKLLDLAREIIPGARRFAVMWNPDNPGKALELREFRAAARRARIALAELPVRSAGDIEAALAILPELEVAALVTLAGALTAAHRSRIAQAALASATPTVFNFTPHVAAGGLVSYSPRHAPLARRLGDLAGRILSGADPATLAVELPSEFELAVNLKTATALGITIPGSVLVRADQVIE
jgi:putative ABC transport system substrate-binding protein